MDPTQEERLDRIWERALSMPDEYLIELVLRLLRQTAPIQPSVLDLNGERVGHISIDPVVGFAAVGEGNFQPKRYDPDIWTMRTIIFWLVQEMLRLGLPTMFIGDCHPVAKPEKKHVEHCLEDSGEELLVEELRQFLEHMLIQHMTKDAIDAYADSLRKPGLYYDYIVKWVNHYKMTRLIVTGIATDMCSGSFVLSMLSAMNSGAMPSLDEIVVLTKGMATFNLSRGVVSQLGLPKAAIHPQPIMQHMALKQMSDRGALIVSDIILPGDDQRLLERMPVNLLEDLGFQP